MSEEKLYVSSDWRPKERMALIAAMQEDLDDLREKAKVFDTCILWPPIGTNAHYQKQDGLVMLIHFANEMPAEFLEEHRYEFGAYVE